MAVEVQNATASTNESVKWGTEDWSSWLDFFAKPYEPTSEDTLTFSHVTYVKSLPRDQIKRHKESGEKVIDLNAYRERKAYIDMALEQLGLFHDLEDGWDGEDGVAPSDAIIDDARAVLQMWPTALGEPVVEPDDDGHIVVNAFDEEGLITACIEFVGENGAIFIGMKNTELFFSKSIPADDQTAIINAYKTLAEELAAKNS